MDDPLFDPWCLDEEPSPPGEPREKSRWRSPEATGPMVPAPGPVVDRLEPEQVPARRTPRSRLSGTPGFLRSMAAPRLQAAAQRASMARHDARMEDLLDSPRPTLGLTLLPWTPPLSTAEPVRGRLEIGIQDREGEHVTLRYRIAGADGPTLGEERIATAKLTASWLDARVLDFIARVLAEA